MKSMKKIENREKVKIQTLKEIRQPQEDYR